MNDNVDGLTRSQVDYQQVEDIIRLSFSKWGSVSNLHFYQLQSGNADIMLSSNNISFDGKGGSLAHALWPLDNKGIAKDLDDDDDVDDDVTLGFSRRRDLLYVTMHNIGHALGLKHSVDENAVMYAWYRQYDQGDINLSCDDILGIRSIYGKLKLKE